AAEKPQAAGGFRAWISYLPGAKFVDDADFFAPGRDYLDATPEALPGGDARDIVERARQALGTRVERLLSNFAFEAAARKEEKFHVTEGERFTTPVYEALLQSLPILPAQAGPVFSRLVEELRQATRNQLLGGDWGWLREGPSGLVLEIAAPLQR